MNKGVIFGLGVLVGAAGGSVTTYFLTKEKIEAEASDEIEAYAEHCEERIAKLRTKYLNEHKKAVFKNGGELDPEEEKIESNEGVKKYHHNDGISSKYGDNNIFEKAQSLKERAEIKKENETQAEDSKLINEITEDEFLNEDDVYEKYTVDVLLGDDKDIVGIWGYGTDNETFADQKFGMPIEELLNGMPYEELLTYAENPDGVGALYLRNDELNTDFEFLIKDQREEDR